MSFDNRTIEGSLNLAPIASFGASSAAQAWMSASTYDAIEFFCIRLVLTNGSGVKCTRLGLHREQQCSLSGRGDIVVGSASASSKNSNKMLRRQRSEFKKSYTTSGSAARLSYNVFRFLLVLPVLLLVTSSPIESSLSDC